MNIRAVNNNIASKLKSILPLVRKLVGHQHCYLCHQNSAELLCEYCYHDTPMPIFPAPGHNLLGIPSIAKNLETPLYHDLHAVGEYAGILSQLINQLKYSQQLLAGQVLCTFFKKDLYKRLLYSHSIPELIMPVPLHYWRYIKRQYNQARVLSKHLSEEFDIPHSDALTRTKYTKQQTTLSRQQRHLNLASAFELNTQIDASSVALVDDVVTTGATVNQACKAILNRYPDMHISVWCMAITLNK